MRIECNWFEGSFDSTIKKIDISAPEFISKARESLKHEANSLVKGTVDVRAKVYLLKNDSVVAVYCMDGRGLMVKGEDKYVRNKPFEKLIYSEIEKISWP